MSFDAGAITGKLGLDVGGYAQGMLQATSIAELFPGVVTSFLANPLLGLIDVAQRAAGFVVNAVKQMGGAFDDAGESAEKLGVGVEWLTAMNRVAADAGSSAQGLANALVFLNDNAANAAAGEKSAVDAFKAIGISADFLKANLGDTQKIFQATTSAIERLDTQAAKTQALRNLLGRGGTELTPLINMGTAEVEKQMAIYRALGGTVAEEQSKMGDAWGTLLSYISAAMDGIKSAVATPILAYLADHFDQILPNLIEGVTLVRDAIATGFGYANRIIAALWPTIEALGTVVAAVVGPFIDASNAGEGYFGLIESLAILVSSVLVPALNLVAPALNVISQVLSAVYGVMAKVIAAIADAVTGLLEFLGLSSRLPSISAPQLPTASLPAPSFAATASGSQAQASGAAPTASRSSGVVIERVEVTGGDSSAQIAAALEPQIRAAMDRQRSAADAAAGRARVSEWQGG